VLLGHRDRLGFGGVLGAHGTNRTAQWRIAPACSTAIFGSENYVPRTGSETQASCRLQCSAGYVLVAVDGSPSSRRASTPMHPSALRSGACARHRGVPGHDLPLPGGGRRVTHPRRRALTGSRRRVGHRRTRTTTLAAVIHATRLTTGHTRS
jgi:hypothetical protein